jgi:ATP-dependent DNA helicase DinG
MLDMREFGERFTEAYFETLFFYNQRVSDYSKIITRDSIPYVMKRKFKQFADKDKSIQVDYRSCTGHKCPFKNECTYVQGLRKAKEADLIVGNHSLLLSWPKSMEKPGYIVIDEAHKLESESTQAFTQELGKTELENFAKSMASMVAPLYYLIGDDEKGAEATRRIRSEVLSSSKIIYDNILGLEEVIERYAKKLPRYTDIYWNEFPMILLNKMNYNL